MDILQISLTNKKQVKAFLDLPFRLYQDIPQWVPPLEMDARLILNPKRHSFYRHSEAAFFLICYADRVIGRLAILNNRRYNEYNREQTAFFYLFECENDVEAAGLLFRAAFDWARQQGLNKIVGPKGFTPLDGGGILVKGFEHRPAFGMPYNPPYYPALIESVGF
ncbi:MAG: hypothetical protein MUP03_06300, partial [Anaerolineales bacterium]|nr:hypothetical protein [Anaerolineales bacterium]